MNQKTKKILYWVIVALLIATIIVSLGSIAYKLITDQLEQQGYEDLAGMRDNASTGPRPTIPVNPVPPTTTDPYKPTQPATILPEFQELYDTNNDMVGWIQIPGTIVDYPVVQSKYEANFYLRKNFYKQYAVCGTIYAREACDVARPSDNVVLYGHHMADGSMFAQLETRYKRQSFWEEHQYLTFDTLYEHHTYQIIACFRTSANLGQGFSYHIFNEADNEEEFNAFIAEVKRLALYDTGLTAEYGDKLLTLSTCCYDLLLGTCRESGSLNSQFLGELAVTQDLQTIARLADDLLCEQSLQVHSLAVLELVLQSANVDGGVDGSELVVEASLRESSVEWHLATLEAESYSAAASGVLTVHTSAGSCSLTGTLAAADPLRSLCGAFRLFKFMNSHGLCPPYSSSTLSRKETLLIAPLVAGVSSSSTE